ncbi:MAG TPA: efflux RND transporter periplasmic adaptor subunit [Bacteroidales bacterium]|nr:efflux RND transporter periplasmic adaptor subunit [Bacteroidales bacterium]
MSKKNWILLSIVIFLILIAIVGRKAGLIGKEKPVEVAVEEVKKRTIYELVTANGKIEPETEVKISADVSGEIIEVYVEEGQKVEKGQLMLKIKPNIYISARDRATAVVNSAKAGLENAEARKMQVEALFNKSKLNYERNEKLWEQKAISQHEWETAKTDFESNKAELLAAEKNVQSSKYNLKSAEASLTEAEENLYKTSIYAPMTGIVTRLNVEKGERVVGTEMMAGTELMRVADLNKMEVKVEVNENDIVRVAVNDTAIIEVDAFLGNKFKGVVSEIANSASSSSSAMSDQVTSFEVKILMLPESYKDLINADRKYPFRPGMTANVDIQTEYRTNVLSVPIEAITSRSDSAMQNNDDKTKKKEEKEIDSKEAVFVLNGQSIVKLKKVKTGIQDNNFIEILAGLSEKDKVVVAPYSAVSRKLKDGDVVKVVDKKMLFSNK